MKLGIGIGGYGGRPGSVADIVDEAVAAKALGFESVWMAQVFNHDILGVLACVGAVVPDLELGTAVVPIYSRHPIALAAQALTVQSASSGRLTLGIGVSHRTVIEDAFGLSFATPFTHMTEYLDCLLPLLQDQKVDCAGSTIGAHISLDVPGVDQPSVLLAALAPKMLQLAGTVADGTVTWMTGAATVRSHIAPAITSASNIAGRPPARIVVGLPVCVTDDRDHARNLAARNYAIYGTLPSYRAMLDLEGAAGPADVAIIGDEAAAIERILEIEAAGATDFFAACFGSTDDKLRTAELVGSLRSQRVLA